LSSSQRFSASGYSSGPAFPTGVSSRDAFAIGAEYLGRPDLKAGVQFELRYDAVDPMLKSQGGLLADRLVMYGQAGLEWRFDELLVALGRARGASILNVDADFDEGQFLDLSLGLAL